MCVYALVVCVVWREVDVFLCFPFLPGPPTVLSHTQTLSLLTLSLSHIRILTRKSSWKALLRTDAPWSRLVVSECRALNYAKYAFRMVRCYQL